MNKSNGFKPQNLQSNILKNYFSEAKLLQTPGNSIEEKRK